MATTDRRFEQLSFGGAAAPQSAATVGPVRLILVAAGFAALIAWGILDQSDRHSRTDEPAPSGAPYQPLLDGHGKWGGYMSQ